jgi:hypothetical protein
MSSYSDSSPKVEETPKSISSPEVEYPHKEPKSDTEYIQFFESLFRVDLGLIDQQELKAISSVIQSPPDSLRVKFGADPRLIQILHCCIARADITFQEMYSIYLHVNPFLFFNLIPVLLWVLLSQKSKRFVEPFLVQYFEATRTKYSEFCASVLNGFEIPKLMHKPISNDEKNSVVLCYLIAFLSQIEDVCKESLKCFLVFAENLVSGVFNPNTNLLLIEEAVYDTHYRLQVTLTNEMITALLLIISKIHKMRKEKRKTLTAILEYSQKEVIPSGIFISKYLLSGIH